MHPRLIPTLLALSLLTACAGPTQPAPRPAALAAGMDAYAPDQLRVLVEGAFTLPSSLISVGSGQLVSVGSGQLVSVGSGSLVSVGTGNYSLLASDLVPVPEAAVALLDTQGRPTEVEAVRTNERGKYRFVGQARSGVYMVAASLGAHRYRSLTALRLDTAVQASVDVATTLVTAKLLTGQKHIEVLPAAAYIETVEAVRRVLAREGLPAGWTPDQAEATMNRLERKYVELQERLADLAEAQARLEQRLEELEYKLQALTDQLEVSSQRLSQDLRAVLSENPGASDEEVTATVSARGSSSKAPAKQATSATPEPAPSATTSPAAKPKATPTPPPSFDPLRPILGDGPKEPQRPFFPVPATPETTPPAESTEPAPAKQEKDKEKGQGKAIGHDKQPKSILEQGAFGGLPGKSEAKDETPQPTPKLPWLKK